MSNRFPPIVINNYIWSILRQQFPEADRETLPFFPVYDNTGIPNSWDSKPYVVYDVIAKYRHSSFYPIKFESALYSVRGNIDDVLNWRETILEELDNGDDTAKDINAWAAANMPTNRVFFHEFTVYQSEFGRAASKRAADTNRNLFAAELIINYRFHLV